MTKWTARDHRAAMREGWTVSTAYVTDDLPGGAPALRLERLDEAEVFDDDEDAWRHVSSLAARSSPLHAKALRIIRENNPTEAALIAACV